MSFKSIFGSLSIVSLVMLCSCDNRPDGVLSQGKMVDLVSDLELAEAYVMRPGSEYKEDSARKVMRQSVLRDHGVSEAEYSATIDWYGHHIDDYTKLYEKVGEKLKNESGSAERRSDNSDAENLWPGSPMFSIMPGDYSLSRTFDLDGETLTLGDKVELSMRFTGVGNRVSAFLGADYPEGVTKYVTKSSLQNGNVKLSLQTDSLVKPSRIYGFVSLVAPPVNTVWVDSIRLFAFPMNRASYNLINTHATFSLKKRDR